MRGNVQVWDTALPERSAVRGLSFGQCVVRVRTECDTGLYGVPPWRHTFRSHNASPSRGDFRSALDFVQPRVRP